MRRLTLLLSLLLVFTAPSVHPAQAKGGVSLPPPQSAGEVIALINGYRAENGLPAYAQNPVLMMTAQGQADWLVSQPMGSVGDVHAGPNGSRPRDRAYAAGYGGGNTIFISEIVKGGYNETPQDALNWWKQSPDHHPTLIASTYQEIGAGAATDGNGRWWYVAVTGWITGVTYTPPEGGSDSSSATTGQAVMIPVTVAEPQPDGSVLHIIRTGQTLWTVAAVYGVPLEQILELNDMPEWAVVRPGDEILVKPAGSAVTATPTADAEQPTATVTSTPTVDLTPAATRTSAVANLPTSPASGNLGGDARTEQANSTVRMIVVITLVSIVLVIAASFFVRPSQAPEPEDEFDPFAPIE
jgi:uncharacterized protein YkwD